MFSFLWNWFWTWDLLGSLCLNDTKTACQCSMLVQHVQASRNDATSCACQTRSKITYLPRDNREIPPCGYLCGWQWDDIGNRTVTFAESVCLVKKKNEFSAHLGMYTSIGDYTSTVRYASRRATFKNWCISCWTGCPLSWLRMHCREWWEGGRGRDSFLSSSPASRYEHVGHRYENEVRPVIFFTTSELVRGKDGLI